MVPKYPFRVEITEGKAMRAFNRETLAEAYTIAADAKRKPGTRAVRVFVCLDEYTRGDVSA
jgi:hypothetical protein